jgi:hypothetical protein
MTEKFFSVVAELEDGTSKVVPVRAGSSGEAFRHARELPGVKRVGRVAEISESAFADLGEGRAVLIEQKPNARPQAERSQPAAATAAADGPFVPHVISGPRTVVYAPPTGGEQPFKHLKAPPERPKPIEPAKPQTAKATPAAAKTAKDAGDATMKMSQPSLPIEYRIVKSRRRDGLPYLVQRGQWNEANGRRSFDVQWEKGFEDRAGAEQHLEWIEHNERELAALQSA